jgi:cytochrome c-type biogenesis protein CcmH/NrfG
MEPMCSLMVQRKAIMALVLVIMMFAFMTLPVQAQPLTPGQIFDKVRDSIVIVKTYDLKGELMGQGSGALLPTGKIATNRHVVEGGASFQVGSGDKFVTASLYAEDFDKDICLLEAKGLDRKPVEIGKTSSLKVGDSVFAVGAPQGLELSLSGGIVSQLRGVTPPLIQTTAAISPGSSGGGLFDSRGRMVGLTTFYMEGGQSLNFALPVEWLSKVKPGKKSVAKDRSKAGWWMGAVARSSKKDWSGLYVWSLLWTTSEPDDAIAWFYLGFAYGELGRLNDAIEAYRQALRIDPEYAFAWYNIGTAYSKLGRHNDTIEALRQALRIGPEHALAWFNIGNAYNALGRHNDAIEALRQALRIDPEYAVAWSNLGTAYNALGRDNDAIEAYRQGLRIDPEYAIAWYNLGVAYALSGNRGAALDAVRELRRLDPALADNLFNFIVPP